MRNRTRIMNEQVRPNSRREMEEAKMGKGEVTMVAGGLKSAGGARHQRGQVLGAFAALALMLVVASTAWACTLLIGELTVCDIDANPDDCGTRTGIASQSGTPSVVEAGTNITVVGTGFSEGTPFTGTEYSILFRRPLLSASCHVFNPDAGTTSLIGTHTETIGGVTLTVPNTITTSAPNYNFGVGRSGDAYPSVATPDTGDRLGSAQVCVQDEPERVDGNFINITVI